MLGFRAGTREFSLLQRVQTGDLGLLVNMYGSLSVKEAGCDPVEWIGLIQGGENTIMNFGF